MKTAKLYHPAYNNADQVVKCVADMLGIDPASCSAELKLVVGWNGEKFITSTDWHIKYPEGICILPPCISPQYPMFIPLKVGYRYDPGYCYRLLHYANNIKLKINSKFPELTFCKLDTPIEMAFKENDTIILSDCNVEKINTWNSNEYHIVTDENTVYGYFIDGKLSIIP